MARKNSIRFIESVWSSHALAEAAIIFHASQSSYSTSWYYIIERRLNVTKHEE